MEAKRHTLFNGIVLPTLTYYNENYGIDWEATLSNIKFVLENGFNWENSCLLVGGAGGDFPSLTVDERISLMGHAHATVAGRVPVGVSVQDTNVDTMIRLAQQAERMGLDYIQVSPTYYYESSFEDFDRVMEAITHATQSISILVYNVPWENVIDLTCEQIGILADKYPRFIGLKWGTDRGSDAYLEVIRTFKDRLQIIDNQNMHVMTYLSGGVGHISHFANVYPRIAVHLYNLLKSEKYKEAQKHITNLNQPWREFRIYMWEKSALESPTVKTALNITGRPGDPYYVRLPSRPLQEEEVLKLQNLLVRLKHYFDKETECEMTLLV